MYKLNKTAKTIFLLSLSGVSGFIGSYSPETDSGTSSPRSDISTTASSRLTQEIIGLKERIRQLEMTVEQISHEPITAPEVVLAGDEAPVVTAREVAGEIASALKKGIATGVTVGREIAVILAKAGLKLASELELEQTKQAALAGAGMALRGGKQLLIVAGQAGAGVATQAGKLVLKGARVITSAVAARIRTAPAQA